jgi:hypothetical protein
MTEDGKETPLPDTPEQVYPINLCKMRSKIRPRVLQKFIP